MAGGTDARVGVRAGVATITQVAARRAQLDAVTDRGSAGEIRVRAYVKGHFGFLQR